MVTRAQYVSVSLQRRPIVAWLVVSAIAVAAVALILLAPLAAATNHELLAFAIYGTFRKLCHQIPERSFFLAQHQFAVCARCTGLYAGFALAVLFYPVVRNLRTTQAPPRRWLFLAATPMVIDFGLTFFGIWENTHTSRFLTGLLVSVVSVFYVMPGVVELSLRRRETRKVIKRDTFTNVSAELIAAAPSDYSSPQRRI